jgi:hypothetical protein
VFAMTTLLVLCVLALIWMGLGSPRGHGGARA